MGTHKKTHPYRVRDNLHSLSIFRGDWSAAEELAMLNGLSKYGIGNWKDIAEEIGTKSDRRVEVHTFVHPSHLACPPHSSPILVNPLHYCISPWPSVL